MPVLTLGSYFLIAGMAAYAAMFHLGCSLDGPVQRAHRLFGLMCVALVPCVVSHAISLQASDPASFISAMRWSLAGGLGCMLVLPWLIAELTGYRPTGFLIAVTVGMCGALIANMVLPYGLQYQQFEGVQQATLPWGETISVGVGSPGIWTSAFYLLVSTVAFYGLVATLRSQRRWQKPSPLFLVGCLVFLVCGLQGLLVRLSFLQTIDLGHFSFLLFALLMSISLNRYSREKIERSEHHFREKADEHIRQLAYFDYLTGLANRAHLHEHLSETLRRIRSSDSTGALLMIDLDHFKTINDALSHDVGDEVLRAVARRLQDVVGKRGFLAHLGGDEFAVVMHDCNTENRLTAKSVQRLAQKIMDKLVSPLFVEERAFTLGTSIGVVMLPEGGETELDVMRHGDMALHRAKHLGRANIQFYSPEMQEIAARRLLLEDGLRRAVGNHELELYFQPQLDDTSEVIGAEVLLRWSHPELGNILPDSFIPIAEETGLIHSVGRWVFDQACARFNAWREQGIAFNGYISINVCPWQFNRADFVEQIRHALHKHSVDPSRIMIELTETALLFNLEETVERLHSLRALGIRVALDDFGTGYSSLAYLRDLPLDQLKIDKAFVAELDSGIEHPLVESMIAIGGHLDIPVVAEGVETSVQREILKRHGCRQYQGYLFSRPLPETDFLQWLEEHQARKVIPLSVSR